MSDSPQANTTNALQGAKKLFMAEASVLFCLDERRFALKLSAVQRVLHAVEVLELPKAPDIVRGIVDLGDGVVPLFNMRKRFSMPERNINLDDHFLVARTRSRTVALWVDSVLEVVESGALKMQRADAILPGVEYVIAVGKTEDGLVLIHDLDAFLSLEEDKRLEEALTNAPRDKGYVRTD